MMKRFLLAAALALVTTAAAAQQLGPSLSPNVLHRGGPTLGNAVGLAIHDPLGTLGAEVAAPPLAGAIARSLSSWKADRINIRDFGAYGDTRDYKGAFTLPQSSNVLTGVPTGTFSPADIGKAIYVWGAGATGTTGSIMSIPVTTPGGGYTAVPSIMLTGAGNGTGTRTLAVMGVTGVTVTSAGAGLAPGAYLFTAYLASGGPGGTQVNANATVQLTVKSDGTVDTTVAPSFTATGATAGLYFSLPASMTATLTPRTAPPGTATYPVATLSFGVVSVYLTQGSGYPLSGMTATLQDPSGATPPTSPAVLGAPVVAAPVAPLTTTIVEVAADGSGATLATAAVNDHTASPANISYSFRWGHDDTAALAAAVAAANTRMQLGQTPCIYAPGGSYMIASPPGQFATGYSGCVMGDGAYATDFVLTPTFAGDLFAWSNAWPWAGTSLSNGGGHATGFEVMGPLSETPYNGPMQMTGQPGAIGQQNALMLYDHEDYFVARDIGIHNITGHGVGSGYLAHDTTSGMRESFFGDLRVFASGGPGIAAFDIDSAGAGDPTNTDQFGEMDFFGNNGPGLWIHSHATVSAVRDLWFSYIRAEGGVQKPIFAGPNPNGDLVEIGDPTNATSLVKAITINWIDAINPPPVSNGVHVTCGGAGNVPAGISITGGVSGAGSSVALDCGAVGNTYRFTGITTNMVGLSVGGSTLITGPQNFDDTRASDDFPTAIDPTSNVNVLSVVQNQSQLGAPGFGLTLHKGSITGGNALGADAIDMQLIRTNAAHAATGAKSVISGGQDNTASNTFGTVAGGTLNNNAGRTSSIGGGNANAIGSAVTGGTVAGGESNALTTGSDGTIGGGAGNSIAGGAGGTIAGGSGNSITAGTGGVISGGSGNTIAAPGSIVPGGQKATDRGNPALVWQLSPVPDGSGNPVAGSAQARDTILRGSATATAGTPVPMVLTVNGAAPAAGNIYSSAPNTVTNLRIQIAVKDTNAPVNNVTWSADASLSEGLTPSTTAVQVGIPVVLPTAGEAAGVTVTVAEDKVLGALVVTVNTPAAGNTHVWSAVARITGVEG